MEIEQGTTVYNRAGEKGRYEGFLNNTHYVLPEVVMYDWEGEEASDWGAVTQWPEVFPKPPTAVLEARVAELSKQCQEIQAKEREVNARIYDQERLEKEMQKRVKETAKQYPAFQRVFDFLDGKITHVVNVSEMTIQTYADSFELRSYGRVEGLQLVSLLGGSKGDLSFRVNHYSDGSGSWKEIVPVKSYEEGVEIVRECWLKKIEEFREHNSHWKYSFAETVIKKAAEFGFEAPDDVVKFVAVRDARNRLQVYEDAKIELKLAEAVFTGVPTYRLSASAEKVDDGYDYAFRYVSKYHTQDVEKFKAAELIVMKRYQGGLVVLRENGVNL